MPFVFDAYGTLFDVHAAIARHREAVGPDAEALTRAQCRSTSGVVPSNARAPSNTEEPSQIAWVRTPHNGTLPSCHSPSKKVQVFDQAIAFSVAKPCHRQYDGSWPYSS